MIPPFVGHPDSATRPRPPLAADEREASRARAESLAAADALRSPTMARARGLLIAVALVACKREPERIGRAPEQPTPDVAEPSFPVGEEAALRRLNALSEAIGADGPWGPPFAPTAHLLWTPPPANCGNADEKCAWVFSIGTQSSWDLACRVHAYRAAVQCMKWASAHIWRAVPLDAGTDATP